VILGRLRWLLRPRGAYRVFTRDHDEVIKAGDLLNQAVAAADREGYETELVAFKADGPLRNAIRTATGRLPASTAKAAATAHVTFLIDHSGSMKGVCAQNAAVIVDELAAWLEASGATFDVLGYTTRDWRGGQARTDWLERGRLRRPGRLCDLRHIIYREDGAPEGWRANLGLLFAADVLREGIDGEALEWVEGRIDTRGGAQREIVIHVGDGSPADDSTQQANHPWVLEDHFLAVVGRLSARSMVGYGLLTFRPWRMDGFNQYPLGQPSIAEDAVAALADLLDLSRA
jgi:cobalamin biosynthesis protein CobT